MMECKKALEEVGGDLDAAIEHLRKQGLKSASKKAGRVAADGAVATWLNARSTEAVLIEVNSETDFVAKNDDFIKFINEAAKLVGEKKPSSVEELLTLKTAAGQSVEEQINALIQKIGEKISVRRFISEKAQGNEKLGTYIHLGSKIGVIVKIAGDKVSTEVLKDVAMHVAASNPLYLFKEQIPADVIAKEKEIALAQLQESGKPANILEKIVEGKMSKFSTEVCLNDQIFIKDPTGKKSVSAHVKSVDASGKLVAFIRYQVGEGIEKKQENFADEVAKMMK